MVARLKIIVLDRPDFGVQTRYRVAFWADVPAARQPFYANASAVSAWSDALTGDTTALQNGSVVEKVVTVDVQAGWTLAQIQAELIGQQQKYQAAITAWNGWARYGSTYDGAWVAGGVA